MNLYFFINKILRTNTLRKKFINKISSNFLGTVLDFGCGNGDCCAFIASKTEYIGVDINKKRLEMARTLFPIQKFYYGNWNILSQKKFENVETLIFYGLFHHLSDFEVRLLFDKIPRKAKKFFSLDPCQEKTNSIYNQIINYFDKGKFIRPKKDLLNLLKTCCLSVREINLGSYNNSYSILKGIFRK